jgi:HSP20 family protein
MFQRTTSGSRQGAPMPLSDAMNQLLSGAFTMPFGLSATSTLASDMNLYETDDRYILQVPLLGVQPGKLNITARDNLVMLQGTAEIPAPQGARTLYAGTRGGPFHEVIQLPSDVDGERATAIYEGGVLTLTLPKAAPARERTIQVSMGHDGQTGNGQSEPQLRGGDQMTGQDQH